jgi:hypothetical protein
MQKYLWGWFATFLVSSLNAGYLYISSNLQPDSINPVVLVETDVPLDPVPEGFSLTTVDDFHALSLITPSEAMAQAQYQSDPPGTKFGSFIYF